MAEMISNKGTVSVTAVTGTLSTELDISGYKTLGIEVPALNTNTTVNIKVAEKSGGTYRTLRLPDLSGDWQLASAVENIFIFAPALAPFQYMKMLLGATQTTATVFNIIGKDLRNIEVTQIFGADDKVVMQGYYCGTNKATGNTFKFNAAQLILRIFHIPGGGAFI